MKFSRRGIFGLFAGAAAAPAVAKALVEAKPPAAPAPVLANPAVVVENPVLPTMRIVSTVSFTAMQQYMSESFLAPQLPALPLLHNLQSPRNCKNCGAPLGWLSSRCGYCKTGETLY